MSVVIDIKVNTRLVETIVVTRVEEFGDGVNGYQARRVFPHETEPVPILHSYDNGIERLSSNAISTVTAAHGPVPRT